MSGVLFNPACQFPCRRHGSRHRVELCHPCFGATVGDRLGDAQADVCNPSSVRVRCFGRDGSLLLTVEFLQPQLAVLELLTEESCRVQSFRLCQADSPLQADEASQEIRRRQGAGILAVSIKELAPRHRQVSYSHQQCVALCRCAEACQHQPSPKEYSFYHVVPEYLVCS